MELPLNKQVIKRYDLMKKNKEYNILKLKVPQKNVDLPILLPQMPKTAKNVLRARKYNHIKSKSMMGKNVKNDNLRNSSVIGSP